MKRRKTLSPQIREQMLRNVFEACGSDPSTVALDTLVSYSSYRKERFTALRILLVVVLLLFVLLPLLFFRGSIRVFEPSTADQGAHWQLQVSSPVPVLTVRARIGDRSVPVTSQEDDVFLLLPDTNGEMQIDVTLVNRQILSARAEVSDVDTERPTLVRTESAGDMLILYIMDEGSGIDYASVKVFDPDSRVPLAFSADPERGTITIAYPEAETELAVSDLNGNILSILLKAQ